MFFGKERSFPPKKIGNGWVFGRSGGLWNLKLSKCGNCHETDATAGCLDINHKRSQIPYYQTKPNKRKYQPFQWLLAAYITIRNPFKAFSRHRSRHASDTTSKHVLKLVFGMWLWVQKKTQPLGTTGNWVYFFFYQTGVFGYPVFLIHSHVWQPSRAGSTFGIWAVWPWGRSSSGWSRWE